MHDDDDPDLLPCYRHPSELTALSCLECDRPICVDCAVQGAVGIKCPDCARTSRAARGVVPAHRLARGIVAAAAVALVLSTLLSVIRLAYFGIILAYLAGMGVGEVARRASGGYRDPMIARGAAIVAGAAFLAPPVLDALAAGAAGRGTAWGVIAAIAAAFGAFSRAS